MKRLLITGGTGFVGNALLDKLLSDPTMEVAVVTRAGGVFAKERVNRFQIKGLEGAVNWNELVADVDVVVHAAARVHVMNDRACESLAEFRKVNVEGTVNLARQAAVAGVRRFVFVSSVKVNGDSTEPGRPYMADDVPRPLDPYGISKLEAERELFALAAETGMEVVVIRPVLVYGPGVKANFHSMMTWLSKGIPLPLGAIDNRRSLVALENLVDLIVTCIDHPKAGNQIFLVSDDNDLSTTDLLRRMGQALGKQSRLLPVPAWILANAATILGKRAFSQRLCGSLQVDIGKTRQLLGWSPPMSVDEGLAKTAEYFLEHQRK